MDKSDIPDESTNVEEIMRNIKENIKTRRAIGVCANAGDTAGGKADESEEHAPFEIGKPEEWDYVNSNRDIQNDNYFISSHRRILGKVLVKGRELVHGEVRRYVDPMVWTQKEFNACIVRILNDIAERLGGISAQIDGKIAQSQSTISAQIDGKIAQSQSTISAQVDDKIAQSQSTISAQIDDKIAQSQSTISAQVDDKIVQSESKISSDIGEHVLHVVSAMNKDIENRAWLAGILEDRISKGNESRYDERAATQNGGLNYFVFEELFRGSRDDTKGKQSKFVKYFEGCRNVLDIGCGRGEFLELLVEHGISGRGIDIDEDMVRFCKSRDLKAEKLDAIDYLSQLEDKSLDGIFIDQVVEHLDPDYLIRMISLCYTKMLFGGYIVIETVNPLSLVSFANFYMDMSHKRPIHPETLKFLIRAAGFREAVAQFYEPVGEDRRLRPIDVKALGEEERRAADLINRNTEVLNNIIFGPQDYAVIGKK